MDEEAISKAVSALTLKNADDEVMSYTSHRALDAARQQVIATAFPDAAAAGHKAVAVVASKGDEVKEFVAVFKCESGSPPASPQLLMGSCQITYEDLTPSDCIEYAFGEAPDEWRMTQLSQEALETYRGMKFEAWKSMLVNPTCEAQFRRMLQIGMISQLYDPQVFPTPESLRSKYQVTDERTGKLIELPHPVKGLRIWDAKAQAYKAVETQLTGAPGPAESAKWWGDFIKEELNAKHGDEYITNLMAGK